jgi:cysteine desulfurase
VALQRALGEARTLIARTIGAHSDEIVFTSNATESDNLAIVGSVKHFLQQNIAPKEIGVYMSPFEHAAISESLASLHPDIFVSTLLQEDGYVKPKHIVLPEGLKAMIVSVMMVQNEIGTVQDIKEIAKYIRKLRKEHPHVEIRFHTDATQAPLFYDLNVARLGVDMMTLGATKLYCQKGLGMLYKKRGMGLAPIMHGGGQEFGLRPGTEPVALIHQFAHALSYTQSHREEAAEKIQALQNYFESTLRKALPSVWITARTTEDNPMGLRSPHITHIVVLNMDSELLVIELDARGIAVSSKSACKNEDGSESELLSLLYPGETVGAIRVSYGRKTTKRELNKTIRAIQSVLKKYQK